MRKVWLQAVAGFFPGQILRYRLRSTIYRSAETSEHRGMTTTRSRTKASPSTSVIPTWQVSETILVLFRQVIELGFSSPVLFKVRDPEGNGLDTTLWFEGAKLVRWEQESVGDPDAQVGPPFTMTMSEIGGEHRTVEMPLTPAPIN
jgi:hypothetical protein